MKCFEELETWWWRAFIVVCKVVSLEIINSCHHTTSRQTWPWRPLPPRPPPRSKAGNSAFFTTVKHEWDTPEIRMKKNGLQLFLGHCHWKTRQVISFRTVWYILFTSQKLEREIKESFLRVLVLYPPPIKSRPWYLSRVYLAGNSKVAFPEPMPLDVPLKPLWSSNRWDRLRIAWHHLLE